MVSDVAKDCFAFVALGFAVLLGFGVAFHVLFRHILAQDDDAEPPAPCPTSTNHHPDVLSFFQNRGGGGGGGTASHSEDDDGAKGAFGTLPKSLLTMFYALLGEFDSDVSPSAVDDRTGCMFFL